MYNWPFFIALAKSNWLFLSKTSYMATIFSEFPGVSKAEWIEKIEKDLKGKPFSDLQWHITEGLTIDPFFTPEDFEAFSEPIPSKENVWLIGESISASDVTTANRILSEALNGGLNAPEIKTDKILSSEQWTLLFKRVQLEMIYLQFDATMGLDWVQFINSFLNFLKMNNIEGNNLKGAFKLPMPVQIDLLNNHPATFQQWNKALPNFSFLHVDGRAFSKGYKYIDSELESISKNTIQLLECLKSIKTKPLNVQFSLAIGTSFFVEIAKIRAVKLIWGNLLKAYNFTPGIPFIDCSFSINAMTTDSDLNMIRNTSQAMSAILGGSDRITVAPANIKTEKANSFSRRIARNVQHLLQLESHFNKVDDPAAGSYYIEKLTSLFCESTWNRLA